MDFGLQFSGFESRFSLNMDVLCRIIFSPSLKNKRISAISKEYERNLWKYGF